MFNLLYKDLTVGISKANYIMLLLGAMVIIPNYPSIVAVGYVVLITFLMLTQLREQRDIEFSAMLPVTRNEIYKSRIALVSLCQLAILAVCAICTPIVRLISPNGNFVGIDINFTFFGVALICLSIFNIIFFPMLAKNSQRVGIPSLIGVISFTIVYIACELIIQLTPLRSVLDGTAAEHILERFAVFSIGAVLYAASVIGSYFIKRNKFIIAV